MKDVDLQVRLIDYLDKLARRYKTFPHTRTAKQAAESVGGSYTRVGIVASAVVAELQCRGFDIEYIQTPAPLAKAFVISSVSRPSR